MLLDELSMVFMRAKRMCKHDSDNECDHENMGNHLAADISSVPAEGPATLELAGITDGIVTAKSEVLGPWSEAGRSEGARVGLRGVW